MLEITLPKFEERIICQELLSRMEEYLHQSGITIDKMLIREMIYQNNKTDKEDVDLITPKILKSQRDIIRFFNSFRLNLKPFIDTNTFREINIIHFFYLELIRYGFPEIFTLLREDPLLILDVNFKKRRFSYKPSIIKEGEEESAHGEDKFLEGFLNVLHKKNERVIYFLLQEMFLYSSEDDYSVDIWHLRSFGKYFSYRCDNDTISIADMLLLLESSDPLNEVEKLFLSKKEGEIEDKLSVCFSYLTPSEITSNVEDRTIHNIESKLPFEKVYSFVKLLLKTKNPKLNKEVYVATYAHIHSFKIFSKDQFKSFIELWMSVINIEDSAISGDNQSILMSLLYKDNLSLKLNKNIDDTDIELVNGLLLNTSCPVIISQLISIVIKQSHIDKINSENLTLSIESLRDIQLQLLKSYLANKTQLIDEVFSLLYQCQESIDPTTQHIILNEEALEVTYDFIEKHPNDYITNFIRMGSSSSKNSNTVFPEPFYKDLFKSNENFEKFIMKPEFSSFESIDQVRNYWEIFKFNDYKPIEFNNQGVVQEIVDANFKIEIEKLNVLKEIYSKVNIFSEELKQTNNDIPSGAKIRRKLKELEARRSETDLYIAFNGQIHSLLETLLSRLPF